MKLILTDIPRYCPEELPDGYRLMSVGLRQLGMYNGSKEVEAVLCSRRLARALTCMELPACRLVQLFSVGYDDIDLEGFLERGIPLCNAAGVYDHVLAEYVVYAMLLYAKRYHRRLANRWWRPFRNYHYMTELAGKTVGVMGVGRIGTAVSRCLNGLGMTVLGYARQTERKEGFERIFHQHGIGDFFSRCDFVVNTLPHDATTIGLIDASVLQSAKSNMMFVNIGRESIFHGHDFYDFLKEHRDAAAVLDLFEWIPNPLTNKYRRLANVLVTPRISAVSQESSDGLKCLIRENLAVMVHGGELKNRVI